jgi:hypothetical protein
MLTLVSCLFPITLKQKHLFSCFRSVMKKTFEYVLPLGGGGDTGVIDKSVIVGVGSVESSYLVQALPCVTSFSDPDLPGNYMD